MKRKILCLSLVLCVMCSAIFALQGTVCAQDIPIVQAYTANLSQHGPDIITWYTPGGEEKSIATNSKYAIYDIDKDLVPEMIVSDAKDSKLYVYSMKNGVSATWSGYVDAYSTESFFEHPGGIAIHGGGMGKEHYEYIYNYEFSDQGLSMKEKTSTGYSLDDTLSQLHSVLSGYQRIVFKDTTDLSLLENLKTVRVAVNGNQIWFDQPPVNENGRVLVPVRAIFEAFGYGVEWYADSRTAIATAGENTITVQVDNPVISYGVSTYWCDVPPQIISNRILVPVRAVAESVGCTVNWNSDANLVEITKN